MSRDVRTATTIVDILTVHHDVRNDPRIRLS
jgi:hypothetical protein